MAFVSDFLEWPSDYPSETFQLGILESLLQFSELFETLGSNEKKRTDLLAKARH